MKTIDLGDIYSPNASLNADNAKVLQQSSSETLKPTLYCTMYCTTNFSNSNPFFIVSLHFWAFATKDHLLGSWVIATCPNSIYSVRYNILCGMTLFIFFRSTFSEDSGEHISNIMIETIFLSCQILLHWLLPLKMSKLLTWWHSKDERLE